MISITFIRCFLCANQECALHGYLSFLDRIYFFSKFGKETSGMKVLKYIYSIYPIPFLEHRERVYSFSDMKFTYIIPTQIEACLAASMLELDSVTFGQDDKAIFNQLRYYDEKSKTVKDCNETRIFSFLEMIKEYLSLILPWPKEMNSKFRGVLPWCVKYCAFFSKQYRHIFYSEDIFVSTADIPRVIGEHRVSEKNPNECFIDSFTLHNEMIEMLEVIPKEGKLLRTFLRRSLFLEFDPGNRSHVRWCRLLLALPIMGGFGRADKYAAAPVSADNYSMIVNDVGERMKNLVVRLHREALDHRIMPVTPEDWRRISFGYFKSTGASESVKIPVDGKNIKVNTKAAVGVIRGENIFDEDMERTFDTFNTRLSTGSRDVPERPRRTIFPVPLTVDPTSRSNRVCPTFD